MDEAASSGILTQFLESARKMPKEETPVIIKDSDDETVSVESYETCPMQKYDKEFVNEELEGYGEYHIESNQSPFAGILPVLPDDEDFPLDISEKYDFSKRFVEGKVPISCGRQELLEMIRENRVILVQGIPGSGKTTQVPQIILDNCKDNKKLCKIVISQHNKISTICAAERVCRERDCEVGTLCGYKVEKETNMSDDTLITFMTTSLLLKQITSDKTVRYSHVIIDDFQERSEDIDFILIVLRRFLFTNSPNAKLIIMSPLKESIIEEITEYFPFLKVGEFLPVVYANKTLPYKNAVFYIDDLVNIKDQFEIPEFNYINPSITQDIWHIFKLLISDIDKVDRARDTIGNILVFLPGVFEIFEAKHQLEIYLNSEQDEKDPKIDWEFGIVYSWQPYEEQVKIFEATPPGCRRVILATDVIENSITISDCRYVVDFCLTKVMFVDPDTKISTLVLQWASPASCDQRTGRVGRVCDGRSFRLITREFFDTKISEKATTKIHAIVQEKLVLKVLSLDLPYTALQALSLALQPPKVTGLNDTYLFLKETGGVLQTTETINDIQEGEITVLGRIMLKLPFDIRLSKLIVLGQLFDCLEETIIMAAGCCMEHIFDPSLDKLGVFQKMLEWDTSNSNCDLIVLFNIYKAWENFKSGNDLAWAAQEAWCKMNSFSLKALTEWDWLIKEIEACLANLNFKATSGPEKVQISSLEKTLLLKILNAGAFYPNFFVKLPIDDSQRKERAMVKIAWGKNVLRTVFFTANENSQPRPTYEEDVKEMISNENVSVAFDGYTRIHIEFKRNGNSQDTRAIPIEVLRMLKTRKLKHQYHLPLHSTDILWEQRGDRLSDKPSTSQEAGRDVYYLPTTLAPSVLTDPEYLTVKVMEYIDAGHFWVNLLEQEGFLSKIEEILNSQQLRPVFTDMNKRVMKDKVYVTRFKEDNMYYRCKIVTQKAYFIRVFFIDYGNIETADPKDIYYLPGNPECQLPPFALECILTGIKPARLHNPRGFWSDHVNNICRNHIVGMVLYAKIHNIVGGVYYVELFRSHPHNWKVRSVNQIMVEKGFAEVTSHYFTTGASPGGSHMQTRNFDAIANLQNMPKPYRSERMEKLAGPFSPMEIKFRGCSDLTKSYKLYVDDTSVNTVLVDTEIEPAQTTLLVAGYMRDWKVGSHLKLSKTTVLSDIAGLPMVVFILFSPKMTINLTFDNNRVASVLCGLGYDRRRKAAINPLQDVSLAVDTLLTDREMDEINETRAYMNEALRMCGDLTKGMPIEDDLIVMQNSIKFQLQRLLSMNRELVERVHIPFENKWWNSLEYEMGTPRRYHMSPVTQHVWPLLPFVKLTSDSPDYIRRNLEELFLVIDGTRPFRMDLCCELCMVEFRNTFEVRLHLECESHIKALDYYYRDA